MAQNATLKQTLLHLSIAVVLATGVLGAYRWWTQRSYAVKTLIVKGAPGASKGDIAALREAEANYAQALAVDAGNPYALAGLAEVNALLWVVHGLDAAKDPAERYTREAVGADVSKAERFAAEILVAVGAGKPGDGVVIGKKVLDQGVVSDKVSFATGLALRADGQWKAGIESLRRAHSLNASAAHYALALGDATDDDGDAHNAALFWSTAAKINPAFAPGVARDLLGRIRTGEGRRSLQPILTQLAAQNDSTAGKAGMAAIALAQGELLFREGKTNDAITAVASAAQLAGASPMLSAAHGRYLIAAGQVQQGLTELRTAAEQSHGAIRYLAEVSEALASNEQAAKAVDLIAANQKRHAQSPAFDVLNGDTRLRAGDIKGAGDAYAAALKTLPQHPAALLGQGKAAGKAKQYDKALQHFEAAVTARVAFPEVYEAIGLMWIEQGALAEAFPQLEAAEKMFIMLGSEPWRMNTFYDAIQKAYKTARGGNAQASKWGSKEKAYRSGGAQA